MIKLILMIAFHLLLLSAGALYIAEFHLSFSPFKISVARPHMFFAIIFLGIGFGCLMYSQEKKGEKKGFQKAIDILESISDKKSDERNDVSKKL